MKAVLKTGLTAIWPRSLIGQSLVIIALGLIALQGISGYLFFLEWQDHRTETANARLVATARDHITALESVAGEARHNATWQRSRRHTRLRLSTTPLAEHHPDYDAIRQQFDPMRDLRVTPLTRSSRSRMYNRSGDDDDDHDAEDEDHDDDYHHDRDSFDLTAFRQDNKDPATWRRRTEFVLISARLQDGQWLNMRMQVEPWRPPEGFLPAWRFLTIGLVVMGLVWLSLLRLNRPLRRLAAAADRFGQGRETTELPETGPQEIRDVAHAFNKMQDRLTRYIDDRTIMLGALSHDLRTPLTRLRLRAEMVDDDTDRQAMIRDLEAMDMLLQDALSFARDDDSQEALTPTDLVALIQDVLTDFDAASITTDLPDSCQIPLRAHAMRRALGNVIANAVNWGAAPVTITLAADQDHQVITIRDSGPGIGDIDPESLFRPFTRGETSRNRETGGTGLGLAITCSILRAHNGKVTIQNGSTGPNGQGKPGGLVVEMILPLQGHKGQE